MKREETAMDKAEAMIVSGLDQDWARCVDAYDALSAIERGHVAEFLLGRRRHIPTQLRKFLSVLSQTAFVEAAKRWARRAHASEEST